MHVTVFDLDDTLYPELSFARSGLIQVGMELEERLGCAGITEALLQTLENGTRGTIFNEVFPQYDVPNSEIERCVEQYRNHRPQIELYPDADTILDKYSHIAHTAILTDGPVKTQRNKVEALGLSSRVDEVVYTDDFGRSNWKPSPMAYRYLVSHFGIAPDQFCYIGDNPEKDFVAARELGWTTIRILRSDAMYERTAPSPEHKADHVIESFDELTRTWPI